MTMVLFWVSCQEKTPYVLAETVQIEYYDTLRVNDWINIDGIQFEHITNYELLKGDTVEDQSVALLHKLPATIQQIRIPGAEDKLFNKTYNRSDLAYALFLTLAQMGTDNDEPMYQFQGSSLDISRGVITFSRTDKEPIKVSTVDKYGAAVRKVKDEKDEED